MTERDTPPEPVSDLDREGIPEMQGAFPGEAATGVTSDGLMAPGDDPRGVEDFGLTAAEQLADEPLSVRVLREMPEEGAAGEAVVDDADTARGLLEPEEGSFDDDEGDLVGIMSGYDPAAPAAEEAAVHVTAEDKAPGVTWDESPDYVGNEAPGGGAGDSPPA